MCHRSTNGDRKPVGGLSTLALALTWLVFGGLPLGAGQPAAPARDGCVACHSTTGPGQRGTPVAEWDTDVHRARGFSCVDCHGGNPGTEDKALAKDPKFGYRGAPLGQDVIAVCARCHSDPELMRRYSPRQRVNQASEYATSAHGRRLAAGDSRVATCSSCHQAHGIRLVSDARSPVFPLNVAATCARCHADPERMKGYSLADGSPLPTNQHAEYLESVHNIALTKRADLSAPTCNDCHGSHGAAPPGVAAAVDACATCHAVFATRFEASVHRDIFDRGCVECHGNHAVRPSSDEMLGSGEGSVCATCHSDDAGQKAATTMREHIDRLKTRIARADELTARVKNAGMEMSDQDLALVEARTRLTLARTEMHTTDPSAVEPVVAEGLKIVDGIDQAGEGALAELRFRRRGLALSLVAILLVVVALALKIRDLDRRHRVSGPPA